jgi:hypothetical protein
MRADDNANEIVEFLLPPAAVIGHPPLDAAGTEHRAIQTAPQARIVRQAIGRAV